MVIQCAHIDALIVVQPAASMCSLCGALEGPRGNDPKHLCEWATVYLAGQCVRYVVFVKPKLTAFVSEVMIHFGVRLFLSELL